MEKPLPNTGYEDLDLFLQDVFATMKSKGHDYRQGNDKDLLHNFRTVAGTIDTTIEKCWATYFYKHYAALMTYVQKGQVESEPIKERVKDLIVYLVLFIRIIDERENNLRSGRPKNTTASIRGSVEERVEKGSSQTSQQVQKLGNSTREVGLEAGNRNTGNTSIDGLVGRIGERGMLVDSILQDVGRELDEHDIRGRWSEGSNIDAIAPRKDWVSPQGSLITSQRKDVTLGNSRTNESRTFREEANINAYREQIGSLKREEISVEREDAAKGNEEKDERGSKETMGATTQLDNDLREVMDLSAELSLEKGKPMTVTLEDLYEARKMVAERSQMPTGAPKMYK